MKCIVYRNADLDASIYSDIVGLAGSYYRDPEGSIDLALSRTTNLICCVDDFGVLVSFLMVDFERVIYSESLDCYYSYIGLMCTSKAFRGKGAVTWPFLRFFEYFFEWQRRENQVVYFWGTVSTPFTYNVISRIFGVVNPDSDATYSEFSAELCREIAAKENLAMFQDVQNPFILRKYLGHRYNSIEKGAIGNFLGEREHIFNKLWIDEEMGDRLLVVLELPGYEDFDKLRGSFV